MKGRMAFDARVVAAAAVFCSEQGISLTGLETIRLAAARQKDRVAGEFRQGSRVVDATGQRQNPRAGDHEAARQRGGVCPVHGR